MNIFQLVNIFIFINCKLRDCLSSVSVSCYIVMLLVVAAHLPIARRAVA